MPAVTGDQQVPRPQEVFISYSRKDKEFVRRLYEALKRRDREAWVDWEDVRPTEDFMQAIFGAIEGADMFISVLTPDSIASIPCGRETAHAAANNKRMVPIVAREVDAKTVPETLAKLDWISFYQDSDDFEKRTDTLISALDTDLNWVRAHTRLLTRAIEWNANGRNKSFVLRGDDLRSAEQWLAQAGAQKDRQPTTLQTEYIIASRKAATRRQRIISGAVSFALIVSIVLTIIAVTQCQQAVAQRKQAERNAIVSRSQALVAEARQVRSTLPVQSLLLASAAVETTRRPLSEKIVLPSAHQTLRDNLAGIGGGALVGHEQGITCMAFSPDSRWVVTGSYDRTARLWDLKAANPTAQPVVLKGHDGDVTAVAFSPDNRWVVTGSVDRTARLWDLKAADPAAQPVVLKGHDGEVRALAFSPDSRWVVTGSSDSTARLWDLKAADPAAQPIVLKGHKGLVLAVAFSPDSRWVVTGSSDSTARLWLLQIEDLLALTHRIVGRNLSEEEWHTYLPGQPYFKVFPDLPIPKK